MSDQLAPQVGLIMGSRSDWETMRAAAEVLDELGVSYESRVVSAHRTPGWMFEYAQQAEGRGLKLIIAGAGGAAHLPGMVAASTLLPVLGVPVKPSPAGAGLCCCQSSRCRAGVAGSHPGHRHGGAKNAGLLAARILAMQDERLRERLAGWTERQTEADG